jgi:hypothetical protein
MADPGDGVDLVVDPVAQRDRLAHLVREALAANLDLHHRVVERPRVRHLDEVVRRRALHAQELSLARMRNDRESLTISRETGSVTRIHVPTPQGGDRRNTFGVPLAPAARFGELGPLAATGDRSSS